MQEPGDDRPRDSRCHADQIVQDIADQRDEAADACVAAAGFGILDFPDDHSQPRHGPISILIDFRPSPHIIEESKIPVSEDLFYSICKSSPRQTPISFV